MTTTSTKAPAKYRLVEKELRDEILSGLWAAGERLPGEHELARRFDVAYMTLRQAIAGLIDEGLLLRINGKGTFVADRNAIEQPIKTQRPLVLLIPSSAVSQDSYYFPDLLAGFQSVMQRCGLQIVPYNWEDPEPPSQLAAGSAVACLLTTVTQYSIVEMLRDNGFPVLAINRYTGRRTIPSVRVDDKGGVAKSVDYLVRLGHRKLGFVRAFAENIDARDRTKGFRSAVAQHKLPSPMEAGDGFSESAGYAAALEMLSSPDAPTAIICASDLSALGALRAARDLGIRVPQDLSVVGFGDFSIADYASPRLTTVRQDRFQIGHKAAENLLRLANDEEVTDLVIPGELIIRESSAPLNASPIAADTSVGTGLH